MKKKIFILFIFFIILFSGFIIYLNIVLLPIKLKAILIKNIESVLQRKVSLESLHYHLLKGIILQGITIFENQNFNQAPFIKIKEISFNLLYLPLFKEKKIIIPSLRIDSAEFKLIREKDNLWNFSDLLNLKSSDNKSKQKLSFLIYKVSILHSKAILEDKTVEPHFSKELQNLNIRINFALPSKLKFIFDGKILNQNSFSLIALKGEFDILKQKLNASLLAKDIVLIDYSSYYQNLPFVLKSGKVNNLNLNLKFEDKKFNILAKIESDDMDIAKDAYEFKGSPIVNVNILYSPEAKEKIDYSGEINPNGSNISGVNFLNSLKNLTGKINFDSHKIQFSNLQGNAFDTLVNISGALENFANPSLNLNITSDVEVSRLREIFKQQLKDITVNVEGKTHLNLQLTGLLNEISTLELNGEATFLNLVASLPDLPQQIKNLSGQINFDLNGLNWKNLKAQYANSEYISNGVLKNFLSPTIEADLKSGLLFLTTKFNLENDKLFLEKIEGNFLDSNFKLYGEADIRNKENPFFDISLELSGQLKDLKQALPKFKDDLEKIKPQGLIKLIGSFAGNLKDRKFWQTHLKADSQEISLWGLKLDNLSFSYILDEATADNLKISADVYSGKIAVLGKIDLRQEDLPFELKGQITDLDLAKLKLDTPFKDKSLYGIFSGEIMLSGLAQNLESWQGRSSFIFKDGNLWELNLFKGLGKFLLIPEFEKIVFNEAAGDFSMANKNITTDNLELKSNELILDGKGSVDFSGNINLRLLTQFSEQFIQNSASLKTFLTNILTTASQVLTIKVTGTLQNPKFSVKPIVTDILKNLPGIIFENILKR
ncbi:MAG: AsmA-like C-terminal region-containing protein [Candidatus Omnitrophota bacterium]|nr:AsmA-like C-terminal region-containing protein [Candidatus Omnitrophota bacterium]